MSGRRLSRPALVIALAVITAHAAASAASAGLTVSATVVSKSNCKFNAGALALTFGSIDPSRTTAYTASTSITFVCNGMSDPATFAITADNGQHFAAGQRRMQTTTAPLDAMGYSLAISPSSGTVPKGEDRTLTISGEVQPSQFQNARAAPYQDTVRITLSP